ncbi:unnamed protein product [Larinioides sclopetarius]|uniref:GTP-binding protein n=1 Tax=Larinioides sclopetarius TaxID=280406 RepID=A0AAV2AYB0_9ARAC
MSLDRSHPVFRGHPGRDRTPPRFRVRSLDEEIGSRTFGWKYRRYICILGDQNTGRRSLARRFFRDRGELRVDGNYWMRGRIPLSNAAPFPRGELDLLIRIVPSPDEETRLGSRFGRTLIAAGIHGNAALFIFAFVCAHVEHLLRLEEYYDLFYPFQWKNHIPSLIVGTKCDLVDPHQHRFMSGEEIEEEVGFIFGRRSYLPLYFECSVLNNINVHAVINEALHLIFGND